MNTFDAIYGRRAIKHFDPEHKISAEDEQKLLQAVIQSPTSYNVQHWRFVVLRDPEHRAAIRSDLGFDQTQITDASLLILFTADTQAWQKQPERYWAEVPEEIQAMMVGMMQDFHQGREWLQRDEAQRSIGMAMQTLMLAAQAMGYQSCPMIGFDIERLADAINLPEGYVIGPMVAIGKGTKAPWPKAGQLPLQELVIEDRFAAV
ncbi:nitroreductase family protein [Oceanospirillum beijerinckii]|uniref:nitroreductase family protein n=1 Tax=Oceanospirillum beijerinckii TaxID=64976 RepID=UPI0003F9B42C|nr:nitroreductase family protein [Oceanospirillum beijerinckii]